MFQKFRTGVFVKEIVGWKKHIFQSVQIYMGGKRQIHILSDLAFYLGLLQKP